MEPRRRPTASGVLTVLAFAAFLGTLLLWWLGTLPEHVTPAVGRAVFGNIPKELEALFYVGVASFLALALYLFALRARNWERGAGEHRGGRWRERIRVLGAGLAMKTLLKDRAAGLMHSMVYFGFVVLFLGTVTLEIDHLLPAGLKFLHGGFYQAYSAILDLAAVVFVAGLLWAIVRRYGQAPWRLRTKTRDEDAWILLLLLAIGVTGVATEAARIAVDGRPAFEAWSFVGYPLSAVVPAAAAAGAHQALWVLHAATFVAFLVVLPTTKLRHMLTSPANMLLAPRDRPKGAMKAMPNLMEVEDIETVGAAAVADFTWKQLLDTDACTICGRCTSVCPANLTGKPLDPREIVLKVGEVMAATGAPVVSAPVAVDAELAVGSDFVFERVRPDEVWSCTSCRACDEICPVGIEILDKILDMRRYLSLMESNFPSELGKSYVAMENQGNPLGMSQQARADWTRQLDFEVKVLGEGGVEGTEYLYWVGCVGSFDDRNLQVTLALARLLHQAGVDFAILGPQEMCTGDPARRSGNEYLFQQLALQNIQTLDDLGVEKVITQCPHCFNTLANEYPQLGGNYEVMHHSQLLGELIREGRLRPRGDGAGPEITFHDPCYLGRYNDVYTVPREVAATGGSLVEMARSGADSFCCGAGGARFWFEEHTGKKVSVERAQEALRTGAAEVAVACPFCYVMIDDGVKELGRGEEVAVRDIAMILAEQVLEAPPP